MRYIRTAHCPGGPAQTAVTVRLPGSDTGVRYIGLPTVREDRLRPLSLSVCRGQIPGSDTSDCPLSGRTGSDRCHCPSAGVRYRGQIHRTAHCPGGPAQAAVTVRLPGSDTGVRYIGLPTVREDRLRTLSLSVCRGQIPGSRYIGLSTAREDRLQAAVTVRLPGSDTGVRYIGLPTVREDRLRPLSLSVCRGQIPGSDTSDCPLSGRTGSGRCHCPSAGVRYRGQIPSDCPLSREDRLRPLSLSVCRGQILESDTSDCPLSGRTGSDPLSLSVCRGQIPGSDTSDCPLSGRTGSGRCHCPSAGVRYWSQIHRTAHCPGGPAQTAVTVRLPGSDTGVRYIGLPTVREDRLRPLSLSVCRGQIPGSDTSDCPLSGRTGSGRCHCPSAGVRYWSQIHRTAHCPGGPAQTAVTVRLPGVRYRGQRHRTAHCPGGPAQTAVTVRLPGSDTGVRYIGLPTVREDRLRPLSLSVCRGQIPGSDTSDCPLSGRTGSGRCHCPSAGVRYWSQIHRTAHCPGGPAQTAVTVRLPGSDTGVRYIGTAHCPGRTGSGRCHCPSAGVRYRGSDTSDCPLSGRTGSDRCHCPSAGVRYRGQIPSDCPLSGRTGSDRCHCPSAGVRYRGQIHRTAHCPGGPAQAAVTVRLPGSDTGVRYIGLPTVREDRLRPLSLSVCRGQIPGSDTSDCPLSGRTGSGRCHCPSAGVRYRGQIHRTAHCPGGPAQTAVTVRLPGSDTGVRYIGLPTVREDRLRPLSLSVCRGQIPGSDTSDCPLSGRTGSDRCHCPSAGVRYRGQIHRTAHCPGGPAQTAVTVRLPGSDTGVRHIGLPHCPGGPAQAAVTVRLPGSDTGVRYIGLPTVREDRLRPLSLSVCRGQILESDTSDCPLSGRTGSDRCHCPSAGVRYRGQIHRTAHCPGGPAQTAVTVRLPGSDTGVRYIGLPTVREDRLRPLSLSVCRGQIPGSDTSDCPLSGRTGSGRCHCPSAGVRYRGQIHRTAHCPGGPAQTAVTVRLPGSDTGVRYIGLPTVREDRLRPLSLSVCRGQIPGSDTSDCPLSGRTGSDRCHCPSAGVRYRGQIHRTAHCPGGPAQAAVTVRLPGSDTGVRYIGLPTVREDRLRPLSLSVCRGQIPGSDTSDCPLSREDRLRPLSLSVCRGQIQGSDTSDCPLSGRTGSGRCHCPSAGVRYRGQIHRTAHCPGGPAQTAVTVRLPGSDTGVRYIGLPTVRKDRLRPLSLSVCRGQIPGSDTSDCPLSGRTGSDRCHCPSAGVRYRGQIHRTAHCPGGPAQTAVTVRLPGSDTGVRYIGLPTVREDRLRPLSLSVCRGQIPGSDTSDCPLSGRTGSDRCHCPSAGVRYRGQTHRTAHCPGGPAQTAVTVRLPGSRYRGQIHRTAHCPGGPAQTAVTVRLPGSDTGVRHIGLPTVREDRLRTAVTVRLPGSDTGVRYIGLPTVREDRLRPLSLSVCRGQIPGSDTSDCPLSGRTGSGRCHCPSAGVRYRGQTHRTAHCPGGPAQTAVTVRLPGSDTGVRYIGLPTVREDRLRPLSLSVCRGQIPGSDTSDCPLSGRTGSDRCHCPSAGVRYRGQIHRTAHCPGGPAQAAVTVRLPGSDTGVRYIGLPTVREDRLRPLSLSVCRGQILESDTSDCPLSGRTGSGRCHCPSAGVRYRGQIHRTAHCPGGPAQTAVTVRLPGSDTGVRQVKRG